MASIDCVQSTSPIQTKPVLNRIRVTNLLIEYSCFKFRLTLPSRLRASNVSPSLNSPVILEHCPVRVTSSQIDKIFPLTWCLNRNISTHHGPMLPHVDFVYLKEDLLHALGTMFDLNTVSPNDDNGFRCLVRMVNL